MNKRAVALILSYMVVAVLTILSLAFFSRSISESRVSDRYVNSTKAFWLSEAGIAEALFQLRSGAAASASPWIGTLTEGSYSVTATPSGDNFIVQSDGYIPDAVAPRAQRTVEAMISKSVPPDVYNDAIVSGGDIDFNGNNYSVTGDVIYADDQYIQHDNVDGEITNDPEVSPLFRFDFVAAREIADGQGNIYDEVRLNEVQKGSDSFPGSFWYTEPTDPEDPTTGVPNVVYVETDLQLNGNIGTIGGFFMVVGDVITDPDSTDDMTVNGIGMVDGVIYTRGIFSVNGGGGNLNIYGGVWCGEEAELNGNAHVAHNPDYMAAIANLGIEDYRITSWRDTQNPFRLQ